MKTKKCSRCQKVRAITEFNKQYTKKDRLQTNCKDCNREYTREHYRKNKRYYLDKNNKRRKEIRKLIWNVKAASKCKTCEEDHPACLVFHHKNPSEKGIEIGKIYTRMWGNDHIFAELEKCSILCSNCHRKLHYTERTKEISVEETY